MLLEKTDHLIWVKGTIQEMRSNIFHYSL